MEPLTLIKKYRSLYNSPTLSDITIILPRATEVKKRKKAGGEPEDERARIFAHKVILGSGSLLLEKHFKKGNPSKVTASELVISSVSSYISPECYEPMLRYIYGLSLDDDVEGMEVANLKELYDAARMFKIPGLREYILRKLEEKLVEKLVRTLENLPIAPEDGSAEKGESPPPISPELGDFADDLEGFLEAEELESHGASSDVMKMVVEVCCRYYAVIRRMNRFRDLAREHPQLYEGMLDCAAAKGGDMLGTDPRTGQRVTSPPFYNEDD